MVCVVDSELKEGTELGALGACFEERCLGFQTSASCRVQGWTTSRVNRPQFVTSDGIEDRKSLGICVFIK